jgi:hypothetical protein
MSYLILLKGLFTLTLQGKQETAMKHGLMGGGAWSF